jgi:hypothetical protein
MWEGSSGLTGWVEGAWRGSHPRVHRNFQRAPPGGFSCSTHSTCFQMKVCGNGRRSGTRSRARSRDLGCSPLAVLRKNHLDRATEFGVSGAGTRFGGMDGVDAQPRPERDPEN